jgi:predicted nucleic acid-binding Zn ribbon protein
MNTERLFQRANKAVKFRRVKTKKTYSITLELRQFVKRIAGPAKRGALVGEAFKQAAGDNLAENCRIESFKAGVLKVKVRPGPYMFELRRRATEIVEKLKEQCPSSHIREIKIVCLEQ